MYYKESLKSASNIAESAAQYIAGGVVSLNRKVSPHIVFKKGIGSKIYDTDNKEYIDYHAGFAPYLLGHNNEAVNEAVIKIISDGWSLIGSGTNELELKLAKLLCETIPSLQKVQITNTGSEATAHAIRLSRAYTNREDIVLMLGGYNGWHNEVARAVFPSLAQTGPRIEKGEYPFIPSSAGIPEATKQRVHIINFNDLDSLEFVLNKFSVACVLTEPVLQNIGVVLPKTGYLEGVIKLCKTYGAVSIFDEVKTGFRSALGGYQSIEGVTPDLSVFGKAIANGYPLGVIGGRKEIMDLFDHPDPAKRVLIAGTYNAHPINAAAAITVMQMLQNEEVYHQIILMSKRLYEGLEIIFREKGIPAITINNASAFCTYFCEKAPADLHDVLENHNFEFDIKYRKTLIKNGIYHIPIPAKQGSVSYAHSEADIDFTLDMTSKIINEI